MEFPMNLGPTINTPYDEDASIYHPDGITLSFSFPKEQKHGRLRYFQSTRQEMGFGHLLKNLVT